jgi:glycosyltransferase involved in cell wall biosynthesis
MLQTDALTEQAEHAPSPAPLVSIIVPAYNVAQFIKDAIESALNQTYTSYEVIVVNDGSPDTDELERVLEPYMTRIVYLKQENRGLSGARNTAIRASRGSFIALLDADDMWLPNYLEVQVERMQSDPTIDVLYPNAMIFGDALEAGREFMEVCPSQGEVTIERLLRQECNVMICSMMRREAVLRAGLFDESLRSVEDFDLWLRIIKQGGRIAYHREVLARYRRRQGSLSSDPIWMCKHILKVLDKTKETLPLTASERATLDEEYERFRATLRLHEGKRAFFQGDAEEAIKGLTEANRFFRDRKISMTLRLLRRAPRLLLRAYDLRDRLVFGMSTKY